MEAETASTPTLLKYHLSKTPLNSIWILNSLEQSPYIYFSVAAEFAITDATELFSGMELHKSACCPNQTELWIGKYQKSSLSSS